VLTSRAIEDDASKRSMAVSGDAPPHESEKPEFEPKHTRIMCDEALSLRDYWPIERQSLYANLQLSLCDDDVISYPAYIPSIAQEGENAVALNDPPLMLEDCVYESAPSQHAVDCVGDRREFIQASIDILETKYTMTKTDNFRCFLLRAWASGKMRAESLEVVNKKFQTPWSGLDYSGDLLRPMSIYRSPY